ncbi:flotillin family protein [Myxococcota bacterium]|nr:flotillin family protein [Myxococcota bacterium]MBU1896192.1 flotillin family protein [Myxococcota bacterium]
MTIFLVLAFIAILGAISLRKLIYICAPNEVLIFSGESRRLGDRTIGYRLIKGGRGIRIPLLERVDRIDLTNMIIELGATGAYSKGGVPLNVHAVANVKIAGREPVLNQAIERFLGRDRGEMIRVAKATLEGALRGVLATMTPEEVNEDKIKFAERLVEQAEADMNNLGMVVDTLNVQNVQDDVRYLDSIGRRKNAEIIRKSRVAEARAQADALVRQAENRLMETTAQITARMSIIKADAAQRLAEIESRQGALVAEEQAKVGQAVVQALAEMEVQKARVEQVRQRLEADVVLPAKAACEAAEEQARADASPIIEDGRARAEVLATMAQAWRDAGPAARDIFLLQKFDRILPMITGVIADSHVEKLTMIDAGAPGVAGGSTPLKIKGAIEQFRELFGVDLIERLEAIGGAAPSVTPIAEVNPHRPPPIPKGTK